LVLAAGAGKYAKSSGTNLAAAHVAGVAGVVWAEHPKCTNAEIRAALQKSALDLEPKGRDVNTGFGLVRAKAALSHLATNKCRAYKSG
jgi:serine protease